jgi:nitrate reductase assembly molybdenum cofactor insertion protein NarJ
MNQQAATSDRALELVAEATRYRLLGRLFERPRTGWREELIALAREVKDEELGRVVEMTADASEGVYLALLGSGGPVSPREASHRGMEDPGHILSDIAGFYEAFTFRSDREDPVDHLAVELDFVAYLSLKSAFALGLDDTEPFDITEAAKRDFLNDHLGILATRFSARLGEAGPKYIREAARMLAERFPNHCPPSAMPECSSGECEGCPMAGDG